jgi:prepilin-type N-terminal cleavage/methylation domain-containing protein
MSTSNFGLPVTTRANYRGFTLLEMLITVTVIGLLMALLFPVLGMVRDLARGVSCANNQRQQGTAIHAFVAEHSGFLPPMDYQPQVGRDYNGNWRAGAAVGFGPQFTMTWVPIPRGFQGGGLFVYWPQMLFSYLNVPESYQFGNIDPAVAVPHREEFWKRTAFRCPSDTNPDRSYVTTNLWSYAYNQFPWGDNKAATTGWTTSATTSVQTAQYYFDNFGYTWFRFLPLKAAEVADPAKRIMLYDSNVHYYTMDWKTQLPTWDPVSLNGSNPTWHRGRYTAWYLDNRVKRVTGSQLYQGVAAPRSSINQP